MQQELPVTVQRAHLALAGPARPWIAATGQQRFARTISCIGTPQPADVGCGACGARLVAPHLQASMLKTDPLIRPASITMADSTGTPCDAVLYRWAPAWGLPSISVPCLQVEVSTGHW